MHTRESVAQEFTHPYIFGDWPPMTMTNALLDEIVRLRTILDNLKGPSADVVEDVRVVANGDYGYRIPDDVLAALIRVAVDVAEEDV